MVFITKLGSCSRKIQALPQGVAEPGTGGQGAAPCPQFTVGGVPPNISLAVPVAFIINPELPHMAFTETQTHPYTHIHSLSTRVRHRYLWVVGE